MLLSSFVYLDMWNGCVTYDSHAFWIRCAMTKSISMTCWASQPNYLDYGSNMYMASSLIFCSRENLADETRNGTMSTARFFSNASLHISRHSIASLASITTRNRTNCNVHIWDFVAEIQTATLMGATTRMQHDAVHCKNLTRLPTDLYMVSHTKVHS